ncbi:hypothetical protein EPA93_35980 [Ktedonosporobacter rubrisoli]|uniref:Uncharacterized protein n=1 Tax=Ktedonosporobacter rubrisoli TaxID=2509675 RepID=A0A4P6JZY2_KTERU|nr:hypothetical protein [Ktedonosporobacter rubrisoli]QBD81083.1 hypothetical protein EPA93_35980 [Ktedonosporobacter rubrisoli]
MSQEHNEITKRSRRAGRYQRNRPVLVTSDSNDPTPELAARAQEAVQVEEPSQESPSKPKRRLPGFFSTIGRGNQEATAKETDVEQARLARASRNKPLKATASKAKDEPQEEAKPAKTSSAPARPASPFKTRYIIGIAIYLLAANFIGLYETQLLNAYHLDRVLTQFSLFGGNIVIRTSTLVFLATLVIILILLARFDLIPRNLGAMSGASNANRGGSGNSSSTRSRDPLPRTRQGVSGPDDELYREFNDRRRRKKK